jgi:hypothetical protein
MYQMYHPTRPRPRGCDRALGMKKIGDGLCVPGPTHPRRPVCPLGTTRKGIAPAPLKLKPKLKPATRKPAPPPRPAPGGNAFDRAALRVESTGAGSAPIG